jgi:hypothetical protein
LAAGSYGNQFKKEKDIMKNTFLLIFTIVLFLTTTVMAGISGTVYISNNNNAGGSTGNITYPPDSMNGNYYTGVYSWTANTATATGEGKFVPNWGFCIDLVQSPLTGWYNVLSLPDAPLPASITYGVPMGPAKADLLYELAGRNWDSSWSNNANKGSATAEAFSYAVWEIVWEPLSPGSYDVSSGVFSTTDSAAGLANTMLASLNGDKTKFNYNLRAISNEGGQDFLVMLPIPATVLLGLLGLGIGGWKLRKSV